VRVFALSDVHLDYEWNARWLTGLSDRDYRQDLLLLAGDLTDNLALLAWAFELLARRFRELIFVPGNHELWAIRDDGIRSSLEKYRRVRSLAIECGVAVEPRSYGSLSVVPLLGWYDYSFGAVTTELARGWMDFRACVWPDGLTPVEIASFFTNLNEPALATRNEVVISLSHFVPRIDVMPLLTPEHGRILYPVLGTALLEEQIRRLRPLMHVYGHSHVNRNRTIDGICYVNNAFGYPHETAFARKQLQCILEI
jgi:predicted phosphodiesterase